MKIICYGKERRLSPTSVIHDYYLKKIRSVSDIGKTNLNEHFHRGFEAHFLLNGSQIYRFDGSETEVRRGEFLLLPPNVRHTCLTFPNGTEKISLTFSFSEPIPAFSAIVRQIPVEIKDILQKIQSESETQDGYSDVLLHFAAAEIAVFLLRSLGISTEKSVSDSSDGDPRVEMAKTFICDNVENGIRPEDVARYCSVSPRHLCRLFVSAEGMTVADYITERRCSDMEERIKTQSLSLKEIADLTGFRNEYYFNTFFKKHFGMAPGEYRKSIFDKKSNY